MLWWAVLRLRLEAVRDCWSRLNQQPRSSAVTHIPVYLKVTLIETGVEHTRGQLFLTMAWTVSEDIDLFVHIFWTPDGKYIYWYTVSVQNYVWTMIFCEFKNINFWCFYALTEHETTPAEPEAMHPLTERKCPLIVTLKTPVFPSNVTGRVNANCSWACILAWLVGVSFPLICGNVIETFRWL